MLRAFVFNRLFVRHDLAVVGRFAAWLDSTEPEKAVRALTMVDRVLRDASVASTGQRRWVLTGFAGNGEPLIEVDASR